MNSRGQSFGFIKILFFAGFFIVIFSLALAPIVSGSMGAADLSVLDGLSAWVASNLNVWIFGAFALMVFGALIYGLSAE